MKLSRNSEIMNSMSNARTTNYTDIFSHGLVQNKPKKTNYSKLINLFLLFSFIVFVGAITFAIQRTTTSTNTRASSDGIPKEVKSSSSHLPITDAEYSYTREFTKVPKQFKGEKIPDVYLSDALKMYDKVPKEEVEKYVANRVILYYSIKQALQDTNISFTETSNAGFWHIEQRVPELRALARKNILSKADFALIKAQYRANTNQEEVNVSFGSDAEVIAKQKIEEYQKKISENPTKYEVILHEANTDEQMIILNNKEKNTVFYNYTSDDNDIPIQENYIFDPEFDDILFSQTPGQTSPVLQLNSQVPYIYFVIYPIKIEEKKYRSTLDIVQSYIKDFTF